VFNVRFIFVPAGPSVVSCPHLCSIPCWIQAGMSVDGGRGFVHGSCMSKTITIDDDAYALLAGLKQGTHDSFTKVIRRHVYRPAETCGELLDAMEDEPPPKVNLGLLNQLAKTRGRRSGGRK